MTKLVLLLALGLSSLQAVAADVASQPVVTIVTAGYIGNDSTSWYSGFDARGVERIRVVRNAGSKQCNVIVKGSYGTDVSEEKMALNGCYETVKMLSKSTQVSPTKIFLDRATKKVVDIL